MSRHPFVRLAFAVSILGFAYSASAETMRCQSVNGNLNCAGSSGVSCQTVNGKTVCVSGHGDVVQSFGNGSSASSSEDADHPDDGKSEPAPVIHQRLEQHGPANQMMLLERDASKIRLRTDWISLDRN